MAVVTLQERLTDRITAKAEAGHQSPARPAARSRQARQAGNSRTGRERAARCKD